MVIYHSGELGRRLIEALPEIIMSIIDFLIDVVPQISDTGILQLADRILILSLGGFLVKCVASTEPRVQHGVFSMQKAGELVNGAHRQQPILSEFYSFSSESFDSLS